MAAEVGHAPRKPQRLSRGEWIAVLKRTVKEFLADDCMGLAQQVAYSALLAFFPAVAFLARAARRAASLDRCRSFLDPVAPHGVIQLHRRLQQDSQGGSGSVIALVVGVFGASGRRAARWAR